MITDAINKASKEAAQAPASAPTPQPKRAGTSATSEKGEAFKAMGRKAREMMSDDQKAVEGSKCGQVEFICALGDPARQQRRQEGQNTSLPSFRVVGYKFRVLEDCMVPKANLVPGWKTLIDTEPLTEVPAKAGEIVSLNLVETADFISRVEYAGKFTGGEIQVFLTAKGSASRDEPLPALNKIGKGSIKENMELIADMIGGDGTLKGGAKPKIKDEFAEKFSVLYQKRSLSGKGTGSVKKAGEAQADLAAAFRQLYSTKRG